MTKIILNCSVGSMEEYRGAPDTDCSGLLHRITIQWNERGGNPTPQEKPVVTMVCEAHVPYFTEMGQREGYQYAILSDKKLEPKINKDQEQ